MKNKTNIIIIAVFLILAVGTAYQMGLFPKSAGGLTSDEIKAKVEKYFADQNLAGFSVVDVFKDKKGLYSVKIEGAGNTFDSYITEDGEKLFVQAIDLNTTAPAAAENTQPAATVETKSDKPAVELFVMSHCPYGTQVEKGILPVLDTLGDKIDFDLKFVYYAMHGEEEVTEQTNQYCIGKNEPEKLTQYLGCFLEDGDGERCLNETGINQGTLTSCANEADNQFSLTANLENKDTWLSGRFPLFDIYKEDNEKYSVQGSPTLVVNGAKIDTGRDSASLLATICSGFNEAPEECSTELSSAPPSAGFGYGTAAAATDASCE